MIAFPNLFPNYQINEPECQVSDDLLNSIHPWNCLNVLRKEKKENNVHDLKNKYNRYSII